MQLNRITLATDKQRLPFNHRQKVYPNGTLLLAQVDRALDQGSYTCVALSPSSNGKNGMASSTLHLSVQMKPVIDPFTFSKSLHEGLRYHVLCSVTRGDSPLTIKWFKDGHLLGQSASHQLTSPTSSAEYSGINVIQVTEFSSSLIFESLRPDHRGNYTCQASNKAGSAAITQSMVVHGESIKFFPLSSRHLLSLPFRFFFFFSFSVPLEERRRCMPQDLVSPWTFAIFYSPLGIE